MPKDLKNTIIKLYSITEIRKTTILKIALRQKTSYNLDNFYVNNY